MNSIMLKILNLNPEIITTAETLEKILKEDTILDQNTFSKKPEHSILMRGLIIFLLKVEFPQRAHK